MTKPKKLKLWPNSKTQIMTKLKKNCNKTIQLKLWQNSNSYCDKNPKIKLWQNLKTQIVTVVLVIEVTVAVVTVIIVTSFSKKKHLDKQWHTLGGAFCDSCEVFSSL